MFFVVIKGDIDEALTSLRKHGIPEDRTYFLAETSTCDESHFWVPDAAVAFRALGDWFSEPPESAPYPAGTLLFFNNTAAGSGAHRVE